MCTIIFNLENYNDTNIDIFTLTCCKQKIK